MCLLTLLTLATLAFTIRESPTPDEGALLPLLNIVFVFIVSCTVAYLAAVSFRESGIWCVVCLGAGAWAYGLSGLVSSWAWYRLGTEPGAAIFGLGSIAAGVLHTLAASFAARSASDYQRNSGKRVSTLLQVYAGVTVLVVLISTFSIAGLFPPFLESGTSSTAFRTAVTGLAAALFAAPALFYLLAYYATGYRSGATLFIGVAWDWRSARQA